CVVATIIDELVLARTSPHHSMNYRSAVVFGRAREVTDTNELYAAARAITRHVLPGREDDAAEPRDADWRETLIVAMPIDEASAKVRTGPPVDDAEDLDLDVWAGTLPLRTEVGRPTAAPDLREGITEPAYLREYRRPEVGLSFTTRGWEPLRVWHSHLLPTRRNTAVTRCGICLT